MKTSTTSDGLILIDWEDGNLTYQKEDGALHRLDGPAVIHNTGATYWFKDNVMHREDGPAVEIPGYKKEWWLLGQFQAEEFEITEEPVEGE